MVIDLYTEQNILIAIFGTVGVLTAGFVLTYSFIWQGREELKRKQLRTTTNDTPQEIDEAFHESWELYYSRWSTESAEEA